MGEGYVIESGTHTELLAKNGAYNRLVQAQKLREGNNEQYSAGGGEAGDEERVVDMEKAAQEEIPLGRRNTRQSLASEILEQRRKAEASGKRADDAEFGFTYIFFRLAGLIRDQRTSYLIAAMFACREFYDASLSLLRVLNAFSQ